MHAVRNKMPPAEKRTGGRFQKSGGIGCPKNAGAYRRLREETDFLLREPGECTGTIEMEGNICTHRLYEKMGFAAVAEHPDAFRMKDGTMRKEIWMVKRL